MILMNDDYDPEKIKTAIELVRESLRPKEPDVYSLNMFEQQKIIPIFEIGKPQQKDGFGYNDTMRWLWGNTGDYYEIGRAHV